MSGGRRRGGRRTPVRLAAGSLAAAVVVAVALFAVREVDGHAAACRSALVPAYVPADELAALVARSPAPDLVVLNPASGPGAVPHDGFRRAVQLAHERGTQVLGYVATGYGRRDAAAVRADVERYATWYGVDGIFLDEASSTPAELAHYRGLANAVRGATGGRVVLNPGRVPDRGYFGIADIVVTFEGPAWRYAAALNQMPAWLADVPAAQVAHLLYDADRGAAEAAVARRPHAGHLYATSGSQPNPWRVIPPYLDDLQHRLDRCA